MIAKTYMLNGARVFECGPDGPRLQRDRDAVDIIGETFQARPDWVVIPVSRLGEGFLDLKTRIAGEALQKFVNYQLRVAIVGDISAAVAASKSLADFVRETNQGKQIWFMADMAEFAAKLKPA